MDWREHFETQIDYQLWANRVLFECLAGLEPRVLEQAEGLFFSSIHHTVDHMHVVLQMWAARLEGASPALDFHRIQQPDWSLLKRELQQSLRALGHLLAARPDDFYTRPITYQRMDGAPGSTLAADILTHLMTHFAHHRGQVSAVATRLGAPAPEMDFLYYLRDLEALEARNRG